jgi:hypothetical protein
MSENQERPANQALFDEVADILRRLKEAQDAPNDGCDRAGPADILSMILRERDNRIRALEKRLTPDTASKKVSDRLVVIFHWIEQWDLRVGDLWLHPKQVVELDAEQSLGFDKIASARVRDSFLDSKGAPYVGIYAGARVFASELVVENHVVAVPDGLDAKLIDKAACMPF